MRTEQESKVESFDFQASIGMDDREFSGDIDQMKKLHRALDALVRKFRDIQEPEIPCNFDLKGDGKVSWSFMISQDDLDKILEKLDKLEGDFSHDG